LQTFFGASIRHSVARHLQPGVPALETEEMVKGCVAWGSSIAKRIIEKKAD
jgi:hypothetical protein